MGELVKDEQEGGIVYEKMYGPEKEFSISYVRRMLEAKKIPYHTHEKTETVIVVTGGQGYIPLNGTRLKVKPGMTIHIPSHLPHTIRAEGEISFYCMETPPDDNDFISLEEPTINA